MKKLLVCFCFLAILIAIASTTEAFDGNRKGFVLGGGAGVAPTATWKSDPIMIDFGSGLEQFQMNESNSGLGSNFLIGYAWDEQNMVVFHVNGVSYRIGNNRVDVTQGFGGASWYHYFGPMGHTGFVTAGLGIYTIEVGGASDDAGLALQIGGGYEFSPHWQFGGYIGIGKTHDPFIKQLDYDHLHFNILIGGVLF